MGWNGEIERSRGKKREGKREGERVTREGEKEKGGGGERCLVKAIKMYYSLTSTKNVHSMFISEIMKIIGYFLPLLMGN